MGDLRVGSSNADTNESNFYCRELISKIFDNRSNCKLVDVYLVPRINNPGLIIKIPAHKLIIQNCQFFFKLLEINNSSNQGQGPVDLQLDSDPISTEVILRYIYTGQLDLNGQNLLKLLQASKYFELPNLTQKCFKFLNEDESNLDVKNWLDLFRFTMTEEGRRFQVKIFEFLRSNISHLLQSDELPKLNYNEIKMLMEPSNRIFPTQKDFNKVMLNWVSSHPDRRQYIDELSELKWDDTIVVDLAADNENLIDQNVQIQNNQIENIQMAERSGKRVNHQITFLVQNEDSNAADSLYTFSFEDQKVSKFVDMPIDNLYFGLISIKNKLFLLGGYKNDSEKYEEMYSLNMNQQEPSSVSHKWKREINLFQKLDDFSTILVNESIYVSGGLGRNLNNTTSKDSKLNSFEMVDLDTKIGRILQNMMNESCDHQLVAFNDKLYAIGGINYDSVEEKNIMSKSVEVYDPVSGNWTVGKSMHDARRRFVAFTTERNIIVLGGNRGDPTMEKFDPVTNSWSRIECQAFPKGSNFDSYNVHITNLI